MKRKYDKLSTHTPLILTIDMVRMFKKNIREELDNWEFEGWVRNTFPKQHDYLLHCASVLSGWTVYQGEIADLFEVMQDTLSDMFLITVKEDAKEKELDRLETIRLHFWFNGGNKYEIESFQPHFY